MRGSLVNTLTELFEAMAGRHIEGGCDDCNAYQTMMTRQDGIHVLTIHHDDTCPFLQARWASREAH
jgi:hypothetical protein